MSKSRNTPGSPPKKRGRPKGSKSRSKEVIQKEKEAKAARLAARKTREPRRDSRGRILKGEVINPKGKPKGSVSLRGIMNEMLLEGYGKGKERKTHGRAVVESVIALAEAGDTKAAQLLFEHNSGKPVQAVVDLTPGNRLEHISDEKLHRLLNGGPKATQVPKSEDDDECDEDADDMEDEDMEDEEEADE